MEAGRGLQFNLRPEVGGVRMVGPAALDVRVTPSVASRSDDRDKRWIFEIDGHLVRLKEKYVLERGP